MSRQISLIVIHCSASPNGDSLFRGSHGEPGFKTPVEVIDGWHVERGFHRDPIWQKRFNPNLSAIGYHYVVYRNGAIATGRFDGEIGAHVQGYNQKSLGVCLVGTDAYTAAQWDALKNLVESLARKYPEATIKGHRDLPDVHKSCPNFDVESWLKGGMAPLPGHLMEDQQ